MGGEATRCIGRASPGFRFQGRMKPVNDKERRAQEPEQRTPNACPTKPRPYITKVISTFGWSTPHLPG